MPLNRNILRFLFQNRDGHYYEVMLNSDGSGYGVLVGSSSNGSPSGRPQTGAARIPLTVDSSAISFLSGPEPRHITYWSHAAVFNGVSRLDQVLTD